MHSKNLGRSPHRMPGILAAISLLLIIFGAAYSVPAQSTASSETAQELHVSDIIKLPGRVLGEGANNRVTGKYRVASYRIEEVALPRPVEVEIGGQKMAATRAFRVSVTGGPFAVRALPPVIWINDTAVGYGVESEDLDAITAVTFDPALLTEGATIYLSYGDKTEKADRVAVPETVKLDGAKGGK